MVVAHVYVFLLINFYMADCVLFCTLIVFIFELFIYLFNFWFYFKFIIMKNLFYIFFLMYLCKWINFISLLLLSFSFTNKNQSHFNKPSKKHIKIIISSYLIINNIFRLIPWFHIKLYQSFIYFILSHRKIL